jgi:hypothetical protein
MRLKAVLVALIAAVTVGCTSNSGSPTSPSATSAASTKQLETVIWGSATGNPLCWYRLTVDTGSMGNPSTKGVDVTGAINSNCYTGWDQTFSIGYGSVSSGPASVMLPADTLKINFTVHTTGSGTDAHIAIPNISSLPAHVVGATVIWGS